MSRSPLAYAAAFGAAAAWVGVAQAQTPAPAISQGVLATPLAVQSANNANNSAAVAQPNGIVNPAPGTIVVHLNARVETFIAGGWSTLDRTPGTGPTNAGAAKLSPFSILGFMRLYPGMDAMAANGLRYGGSIEIRQNFGPTGSSTANSGSSGNTFSSTLFVRRAFAYFARDNLGILRVGQGDGLIGLFDNGVTTLQNFDTGGWDGDVLGALPGNASPAFPFPALQGAEYGSAKLVYLSPQLAGFDFGVAYAPNNGALQDGPSINSLTQPALAPCPVAGSGCATLSSSSTPGDGARFRNLIETGFRFQHTIGAVGIYGFALYNTSGHVNFTGTAPGNQFNGLNFGDFGLAVSYGGLTVGGHGTIGAYNGVMALQPKGGVRAAAWLVGAQYAFGPLVAGASVYNYQSQGSPALVGISQRSETGFAAGGTYTLAPGLAMYASYLYGLRHQGGFNFATGAPGAADNNVRAQLFALGTLVKW